MHLFKPHISLAAFLAVWLTVESVVGPAPLWAQPDTLRPLNRREDRSGLEELTRELAPDAVNPSAAGLEENEPWRLKLESLQMVAGILDEAGLTQKGKDIAQAFLFAMDHLEDAFNEHTPAAGREQVRQILKDFIYLVTGVRGNFPQLRGQLSPQIGNKSWSDAARRNLAAVVVVVGRFYQDPPPTSELNFVLSAAQMTMSATMSGEVSPGQDAAFRASFESQIPLVIDRMVEVLGYPHKITAGLEEVQARVEEFVRALVPEGKPGLIPVVIGGGLEEQRPELGALRRLRSFPAVFAHGMTPAQVAVELITRFNAHDTVVAGLEEEAGRFIPILAAAGIEARVVTPERAGHLILAILAQAAGMEERDLAGRAGQFLDDLTVLAGQV